MTFAQFLAAYVLHRLPTDELPAAALQAIEEGYGSVDLAALAGQTSGAATWDLENLWQRGLRHLGVSLPTRAEAGRTLRDHFATLVASGALAPDAGAGKIVSLATDLTDVLPDRGYAGDGLGVARLLGLYYSHDDVPERDERAHREIDDAIREECRRLVGS